MKLVQNLIDHHELDRYRLEQPDRFVLGCRSLSKRDAVGILEAVDWKFGRAVNILDDKPRLERVLREL